VSNELRVRQNFIGGLVEDNPLASGGTTLTSAALSALVAIGSTQHAVIVLDPDGVAGAPEIVYVTAHTGSATTATILRGQEGTTARAHVQDTPWVHGPTVRDHECARYINRATGSGDITLNSGSWADLDTSTDLALAAQVDDLIEVGGSWLVAASSTTAVFFDAVSLVSGSPVNSWGVDGAVGSSVEGIQAWRCDSNSVGLNQRVGGSMMKAVVSGDLSGGTVTLRLRYKQPTAGAQTLYNNANRRLHFWAKNLGAGA
jgi:hypothetical protein